MEQAVFEALRVCWSGALVSLVVTQAQLFFDRRRKRGAHWAALEVEIDVCEQFARSYLTDQVAAPLYRLPTRAVNASFAALPADGVVSQSEVKGLELFAELVQEINRGLDLAAAARGRDNNNQVIEDASRVKVKCTQLLGGSVKNARHAVEPHVKKRKK